MENNPRITEIVNRMVDLINALNNFLEFTAALRGMSREELIELNRNLANSTEKLIQDSLDKLE